MLLQLWQKIVDWCRTAHYPAATKQQAMTINYKVAAL